MDLVQLARRPSHYRNNIKTIARKVVAAEYHFVSGLNTKSKEQNIARCQALVRTNKNGFIFPVSLTLRLEQAADDYI